jgi:CBS domain-containing protein
VSSLIVVDDDNKPVGIIAEHDLVINHARSNLIQDLISFPLVTADALLSVEVAADKMMQNKVRYLLVVVLFFLGPDILFPPSHQLS